MIKSETLQEFGIDEDTEEMILLEKELSHTLNSQNEFIKKLMKSFESAQSSFNSECKEMNDLIDKYHQLEAQLESVSEYALELTKREEQLLMDKEREEIENVNIIKEAKKNLNSLQVIFEKEESQLKFMDEQVDLMTIKTKEAESKLDKVNEENWKLEMNIEKVCGEVKEMNKYIDECYLNKKKFNNELQELRGNIRVYCRIRPFINEDEDPIYELVNENTLKIKVPKENQKSFNHQKDYMFNFEQIFDMSEHQENIFNELAQLIQSAVDGKNVCIFAYGQTGSGKTFTMQGGSGESNRGIIPRSIELIFEEVERAKKYKWESEVSVTIQEVYLDAAKDLLCPKNHSEDSVSKYIVKGAEEINSLLEEASKNRKVAETSCNEHSSRSHLIFTIHILSKNNEKERRGSLNLIDLAGSERITLSKVEGDRLKETQFINKSLTHLGTVITSLARKESYIPFRNSKLTHLLQKYLEGDSKTLMFVNISPKMSDFNQTICSLRFAEKVKECKINKK